MLCCCSHHPNGRKWLRIPAVEASGRSSSRARRPRYPQNCWINALPHLTPKLGLMDKVLHGGTRWMLGCLFPNAKLQEMLNSFQVWCIRSAMNLRWNGQGVHTEFEIQAMRLARTPKHNGAFLCFEGSLSCQRTSPSPFQSRNQAKLNITDHGSHWDIHESHSIGVRQRLQYEVAQFVFSPQLIRDTLIDTYWVATPVSTAPTPA